MTKGKNGISFLYLISKFTLTKKLMKMNEISINVKPSKLSVKIGICVC